MNRAFTIIIIALAMRRGRTSIIKDLGSLRRSKSWWYFSKNAVSNSKYARLIYSNLDEVLDGPQWNWLVYKWCIYSQNDAERIYLSKNDLESSHILVSELYGILWVFRKSQLFSRYSPCRIYMLLGTWVGSTSYTFSLFWILSNSYFYRLYLCNTNSNSS